jgi:hypothetical protein
MLITTCRNVQLRRIGRLASEAPFISAFIKLCLIGHCLAWGGSLRDSAEHQPRQGRHRSVRQQGLRWRGLSSLFVLFCLVHSHRAYCQVPFPAVKLAPRIAVFGTFEDIKPTWKVVGDKAVWGGTIGGYVQAPHVVGLELRGSITRWGGQQHQEAVLLGPRAALHFGRFSPYVAVLGGVANSWSWPNPHTRPTPWVNEKVAPDLTILGGVDFHMDHHISFRVGEPSYTRIFRSDRALNTFGISVGAVYRLPW